MKAKVNWPNVIIILLSAALLVYALIAFGPTLWWLP